MHLPTIIPIVLASFLAPTSSSGADDDWVGPLVLKVNGKDVKLEVSSSSLSVEEDEAVGFSMDGTTFMLAGDVDLNGDGKVNKGDRPKLGEGGKLNPGALLNKRVLLHATKAEDADAVVQNHVEVPGLGECDVLPGSTATVTSYKKTGKEVDRWSGTVHLNLKPKKGAGPLQVSGRFECGIGAE